MKAIVQVRYGSPDGLVLQEMDKPAVGDGQVLVRVRAASINAYDSHLLRRLPHLIGKLLRMATPRVRGVDLAGTVEAVGKSVARFKPGDEVFGAGPGSFAEYVTTSEERLALKPRSLTCEQAAALPVAGCTALQGLRDQGQVTAGQRVLIYGAGGGVGTLAVLIAKALGAQVTAVSRTSSLDLLRSIGADQVLDYTQMDFTATGSRYEVLFDVGGRRSLRDCARVLAPNGRHVLVGAPPRIGALITRLLGARLLSDGIRRRTLMARIQPADLVALKDLADSRRLTPVIDKEYPLEAVPDAFRYFETGQVRGKVVIRVASA